MFTGRRSETLFITFSRSRLNAVHFIPLTFITDPLLHPSCLPPPNKPAKHNNLNPFHRYQHKHKKTMEKPNILLFGATGRTGIQILRAKARHAQGADISLHAFVRDASKLSETDRAACTSVQRGDACVADDVSRAIDDTGCNVIMVTIGSPHLSKAANDVRERTAHAITEAVGDRQGEIRVMLLSAVGAGESTIKMGFGLGMLVHFYLRHAMKDQTEQEGVFKKAYAEDNRKNLLIIRPPELVDDKPTGDVVTMEHDNMKKFKIDRQDLAEWMLDACIDGSDFGKEMCITTA